MTLLIKCVLEQYRCYLVDDIIYQLYLIYSSIMYDRFMQDFDRMLRRQYNKNYIAAYTIIAIKNRITTSFSQYNRCVMCGQSVNGDKKLIKTIEIYRTVIYDEIANINYHDDCYKLYMDNLLKMNCLMV
jgi:hypothetical protein